MVGKLTLSSLTFLPLQAGQMHVRLEKADSVDNRFVVIYSEQIHRIHSLGSELN